MTVKTFTTFDRLSEDFVRARHDWFGHKLKLVLLAEVPGRGADAIGRGVHAVPLQHSAERAGRTTVLSIEPALVRAEGAIAAFAAVAVVNATSGAPIGFIALGETRGMEEGSSKEFRFPSDVVMVTA
jgi:hypothetical protein